MVRGSGSVSERYRLGPLEQQVMEELWDQDDLTVRALISRLGEKHAYTTIATVLANLHRKGLVAHRRVGRSAYYKARHSRSDHAARLMGEALSSSTDRRSSIMRFVEGMDEQDVALLREFLEHEEPPSSQPGGGPA